ncbi:hypothetical protein [Oceaniserpentilla sp. 4NH20-0058]
MRDAAKDFVSDLLRRLLLCHPGREARASRNPFYKLNLNVAIDAQNN